MRAGARSSHRDIASSRGTKERPMNLRSLIPSGNGGAPATQVVNPFGFLHREIDRLFDEFTRGTVDAAGPAQVNLIPSMDVTETDKEIVITAEMPGLERKDVDISIEDDVLTIRGEKKVETKKDDKDKNYHVSERSYGMFNRPNQVPQGGDPSKVQATGAKGALKVHN